MVIFRSRSFFVSKKFALPYEAERGISMSEIRTNIHQFFYEGRYWVSREKYAAWVRAKRIIVKPFGKYINFLNGMVSGLTAVAMYGKLLSFAVIAYSLIVVLLVVRRVFTSKQKNIIAHHVGKIAAFIASVAPVLMMFFGIAIVVSLIFTADNMNYEFDRALSRLGDDVFNRIMVNVLVYAGGAFATLVSIPIGLRALFLLSKNKPVIPQQYDIINKAANVGMVVVGIVVCIFVIVNAGGMLSPDDSRIALNFARGNILLQEMASVGNRDARVKLKYRVVGENSSASLYIVEIHGRVRESGENLSGGTFMVLHIEGGNARSIAVFAYGDMTIADTTRRDALADAMNFMLR
jgi:hypothetical protein